MVRAHRGLTGEHEALDSMRQATAEQLGHPVVDENSRRVMLPRRARELPHQLVDRQERRMACDETAQKETCGPVRIVDTTAIRSLRLKHANGSATPAPADAARRPSGAGSSATEAWP